MCGIYLLFVLLYEKFMYNCFLAGSVSYKFTFIKTIRIEFCFNLTNSKKFNDIFKMPSKNTICPPSMQYQRCEWDVGNV